VESFPCFNRQHANPVLPVDENLSLVIGRTARVKVFAAYGPIAISRLASLYVTSGEIFLHELSQSARFFRIHQRGSGLCVIRMHGSLGVTPAMEAGITDHVWNIAELVQNGELSWNF
jgi:hypothetical protein